MNYEITDKVSYTTVYFTIEREDGREYRVSVVENDWYDDYQVMDENGDIINSDDPLSEMLIEMCENELKKLI
jgi:hypothetical protein